MLPPSITPVSNRVKGAKKSPRSPSEARGLSCCALVYEPICTIGSPGRLMLRPVSPRPHGDDNSIAPVTQVLPERALLRSTQILAQQPLSFKPLLDKAPRLVETAS